MDPKVKKILYIGYMILLSFSIVTAGICLMAQCLQIYQSGDHPFSTETVAAAFSEIALPVYLCGGLVLIGILLKPFLPCPKQKPEKNHDLILSKLRATTDLCACPNELLEAVLPLMKKRALVQYIGWGLLAIGSLVFLVTNARPDHFDSTEISKSMIHAMYWLLPCMLVPFAYAIFAAYYRKHSIRKEIELLKTAPKEAKRAPVLELDTRKSFPTHWLRYGILALALVLLVGGYLMDGAVDVLTKAVNICTECIGLG